MKHLLKLIRPTAGQKVGRRLRSADPRHNRHGSRRLSLGSGGVAGLLQLPEILSRNDNYYG